MRPRRAIAVLVSVLTTALCVSDSFAQQGNFEREPINYLDAEVNDPVAQLSKKLESGETTLRYDDQFGYLQSVLEALDVPASSQTLVFSKTSLQLHRISPRRPRALPQGRGRGVQGAAPEEAAPQ